MADKMMRVAGRSESGLAKALKTNEDGMLNIFESMALIKSDTLKTIIPSKGSITLVENIKVTSPFLRVLFKTAETGDYSVRVVFGIPNRVDWEEYLEVETGTHSIYNFVDVKCKSTQIQKIEVINNSDEVKTLNNFQIYGTSSVNDLDIRTLENTLELGKINVRSEVHRKNINAGGFLWLYNESRVHRIPYEAINLNLRLTSAASFRLELWIYKDGETPISIYELQESRVFNNETNITQIFYPQSPYHRIRIVNLSKTNPIAIDYMDVQGQNDNRLIATYQDKLKQRKVPLSAEIDDNGNGVLRIVDAAPHAYDEYDGAYRVKVINQNTNPLSNMKLLEQTFNVPAGEEIVFVDLLDMLGYSKFYVSVRGVVDHDLLIRRRADNGQYVDAVQSISNGGAHYTTEYLDTRAQFLNIAIKNNSAEDHAFTVRVMGVV